MNGEDASLPSNMKHVLELVSLLTSLVGMFEGEQLLTLFILADWLNELN